MPQQLRLASAFLYVVLLLVLARYLNGTFWPPYGLDGLWFYSAAAALLLADFLLEPFFTRPADALATGLTIVIAGATVSLDGADISHDAVATGRVVTMVVGGLVVGIAALAISFKDSAGKSADLAALCTSLVARIGRARWLFSLLLLASGYAAFADSTGRVAALYLTWFAIVSLAPIDAVLELITRRRPIGPTAHGVVEALDDPTVIVARLPRGTNAALGGEASLGEDGTRGTVVEVTELLDQPRVRIALSDGRPIAIGTRVTISGSQDPEPIIGHVAEGSSIEQLTVITVPRASSLGVQEGRLLEATIGEVPTLYQVVGAEIQMRMEDDVRRHLVRVTARKLGRWNADRTVFEPVAWVPAPGSPARLLAARETDHFDEKTVGSVPGTTFGVSIQPHLAVTHNTAILGILGIGKTHLAWELIQRMLVEGIKVVALDITGRYSGHFTDLCSPETENAIAEAIETRIAGNVANRNVRNDEAGNLHDFQRALNEVLVRFMNADDRLLVLNPNRFEVTRMEGRPFQGQANMMGRLTMVEITRLIAEQLLDLLQARERDPTDESAAVCLVLEEAHSLVPEWSSATNDAERQAVNGTARAILQGRKYGFGSLLITQRTANVTKSILNQCNTIFGMRVYDATGMGFLENYIGPTYAQLLASLGDRQAVVFGRASSCNSPLIVQLNDSAVFRERFWEPNASDVPVTHPPGDDTVAPSDGNATEDDNDEIPF